MQRADMPEGVHPPLRTALVAATDRRADERLQEQVPTAGPIPECPPTITPPGMSFNAGSRHMRKAVVLVVP